MCLLAISSLHLPEPSFLRINTCLYFTTVPSDPANYHSKFVYLESTNKLHFGYDLSYD